MFLRGIEDWRWEQAEGGGSVPRFSVKGVRGTTPEGGPARSEPSAGSMAVDRSSWERALRTALRVRHYALRTEQTYTQWARQFLQFHPEVALGELAEDHVRRFLEHLAVGRNVTATTEIYTHVAVPAARRVHSPLDTLPPSPG